MPIKPQARDTDLAIRDLEDEVVVYDFARNQALCLSRSARVIWRHCDGNRTIAQLAEAASRELGAPCSQELVWLALEQLSQHQLLVAAVEIPRIDKSRRALVKKMAITAGAAIVLPTVWSIVAPTPAYAASVTCIPSSQCMGVNNPTTCCNSGGMAFACSGSLTCGGTSSSCNGTDTCK